MTGITLNLAWYLLVLFYYLINNKKIQMIKFHHFFNHFSFKTYLCFILLNFLFLHHLFFSFNAFLQLSHCHFDMMLDTQNFSFEEFFPVGKTWKENGLRLLINSCCSPNTKDRCVAVIITLFSYFLFVCLLFSLYLFKILL